MNRLSTEDRVRVVSCLVEGNSIRSTVRMTDVAKNTVTKLLVDLGQACCAYQDRVIRGLTVKNLQCDEIWSFVGSKQRNVTPKREAKGDGDAWTWVCIDRDTKLVLTWLVGKRTAEDCGAFIHDIADRVVNRTQISTDGLANYPKAIAEAFKGNVDYTSIEKYFGTDPNVPPGRYSPAECLGCRKVREIGQPDLDLASTSHVERQNLTMRMKMRRMTRLTNAFSKKLAKLRHAVALHFMHHNFGRVHQTLKRTPAQAAGIADHAWAIAEIVQLLDSEAE